VTDIYPDFGPNYISRENVQRKIVIQANITGRDIRGVVNAIQDRIDGNIDLPQSYFVEYGGQFESEARATRTITLLSLLSMLLISLALYSEFSSFRQTFLILINLPLALIGGVMALYLTKNVISIASLVGFITLFGIAVRNGIILISHYNYLLESGIDLKEAIIRGSLERLSPILMTALTTALALLPLALSSEKPGSEIQAPLSIVVLGGLITATFLNMFVIPVLFYRWGTGVKS